MKKLSYVICAIVFSLITAVVTYIVLRSSPSNYEIFSVSYLNSDIADNKSTFKVFKTYKEYYDFCKENSIDTSLSKKDFNRNSYVLVMSPYTDKGDFDFNSISLKEDTLNIKASTRKEKDNINGSVLYLIGINKSNVKSNFKVNYIVDELNNEDPSKIDDETINLSDEVNNWLNDTKKDQYVVTVFGQTWCPHCLKYKPTITNLYEEYNFKFYWFDLDELTTTDYNKVKNTYTLNHFSGTPYTFVIKNGEFISFNSGNRSSEDTLNYLKASGVVK